MTETSHVEVATSGAAAEAASICGAISFHSSSFASMKGTWTTSTGSSRGGSSSRSWSPRRSTTVRTPCPTSAFQPASVSWLTLSERTMAPNFVSPPSRIGCPPRSRTLRQPSQTRSRSGGNCSELDASERRRGCVLDLDPSQLAGSRRAGEVHGRVAAGAASEERLVGAAPSLDERVLDPADALAVAVLRHPLNDVDQTLDAVALDLVRNLVGERGGLGAGPRRVDEGEGSVVADLLDRGEGLLELRLGLSGEADDQVRGQREVRDRGAQLVNDAQVPLTRVGAAHGLQDPRRAGLERKVRVLADCVAVGHRGDHGGAEVLRMRAREADAIDSVHGVHGAQQLCEVAADVAAVGVHVLAEQRHLADAVARERFDLGQDLAPAPGDLAAPNSRNDAVRADRVAAHRDLHPGLEAALLVAGQAACEGSLLPGPEGAARDALAARAQPLGEVRDRTGPKSDVDERVELEYPLALRLGVAAADGDHSLRVAILQDSGIAEMRCEPSVRLLADRARVEHEDVRALRRGGLSQAELLEHSLDPLRVVGVHLTPESRDVVAAHRCESYRGGFGGMVLSAAQPPFRRALLSYFA